MKLKLVLRVAPWSRHLRLFRVSWPRGLVGEGGYSTMVSFGLKARIFYFGRDCEGWRIVFLGLRVHYERSRGSIHV